MGTKAHVGWVAPMAMAGAAMLMVVASVRSGVRLSSYLSEAGAVGGGGAGAFAGGLLLAAVGALAAATAVGRGPVARALVGVAAFAVATASVPCSAGCPIPVIDGDADLRSTVHFALVLGLFGLGAGGPFLAAVLGPLHRVSRFVATVLLVHLGVLGPLLVVDPHGFVGGVLQRSMLLAAASWIAVVGALSRPAR